jgi:diketogulonate reductase-like aldo/keto reductase
MSELRDEGLVEHLGVSNFTQAQFEAARGTVEAPIVTNQVLYHPYKDQRALRDYLVRNKSSLTAYSPLARGGVLSDELLSEIGERYDKSSAQVALRWLVQQEGVIAIPKASSEEHIEANFEVFDFSLTEQEMERIHAHRGSLKLRLRSKWPSLVRRIPL